MIHLDEELAFIDLRNVSSAEDASAFAIRTHDRPFHLFADSESDKKIWLEELEAATLCIKASEPNQRLGWQHEVVLGTMYSAAMKGEVELLRRHVDKLVGYSLDDPDESGMTALHWASLFGRMDAVELLVEAGSDVDNLNSGLNSALLLAAACGHDDVVLYLVNKRANVHIRNIKGVDCLMMAVLHGHKSPGLRNIIMTLQAQGIDVNRPDSLGATPLHECAARSLSEPIQMLVDAGADVNVKHERNGLTPLQMACSAAEPDPLTVCSFLDKGAHPNWKDTAKRTAFDLVLVAHRVRALHRALVSCDLFTYYAQSLSQNVKTRSPMKTYTKEAIAHLSPFVQTALTTLIMIVRRGGRFAEDSLQHLKPSFQETMAAVKGEWDRMGEPDHFVHYITAKASNIRNFKVLLLAAEVAVFQMIILVCNVFRRSQEMPDNASEHCLLCVDKFTYSNRRHHCRGCGILCCDLCSLKRMPFKVASSGGSPIPSSSSKIEGSRTCDGCFNRLVFECGAWVQAREKLRREQEKVDAELRMKSAAADSSANSVSGAGTSGKTVAEVRSVANVGNSAAALNNSLSETVRALEERGQRLQDTADKSELMVEVSRQYRAYNVQQHCSN